MDRDALRLAAACADDARRIARGAFRSVVAVERKADATPVTAVDREIERRLRARIADARPEDGILGEEHGAEGTSRRRVWVVDPIDGTKAFITGSPLFGTLIALVDDGVPALGIVEMPALRERFVGVDGAATMNGRPCRVRPCPRLADASFYSPGPETLAVAGLDHALGDAVALRRYGGDCYAYCQLALGWVDLVVESGMAPYDFLALVPVVTGAGGTITDWHGAPLSLQSDGNVIAAGSPEVHAEALALIARHTGA
jgi:inositol-phosphate phosphatase / L-galactose 1-phosphate phosphatase / histidinol-phosphatase